MARRRRAIPRLDQRGRLAELCKRGYAGRLMLSHDKASFMNWFANPEIDAVLPGWQYTYLQPGS